MTTYQVTPPAWKQSENNPNNFTAFLAGGLYCMIVNQDWSIRGGNGKTFQYQCYEYDDENGCERLIFQESRIENSEQAKIKAAERWEKYIKDMFLT